MFQHFSHVPIKLKVFRKLKFIGYFGVNEDSTTNILQKKPYFEVRDLLGYYFKIILN